MIKAKNNTQISPMVEHAFNRRMESSNHKNVIHSAITPVSKMKKKILPDPIINPTGILIVSSYPPRECGIATYSQDLIKAINNKFSQSVSIQVCALESGETSYPYPEEVKYTLKTSISANYEKNGLSHQQ